MRYRRPIVSLLILGAMASACTGLADSGAEEDVMVAALEAEIRSLLQDTTPLTTPVICIEINPGEAPQSPRKELVNRLKHVAPHVVRSGECEADETGVVDRDTGRAAVILTAGPVDWIAADDAEIAMTIARSSTNSIRHRYRVAREHGRWLCLGQVMKISPA